MKIRTILKIIKDLEEAYTSSILGQYSSSHLWRKMREMEMRRAGWKSNDEQDVEYRQQEQKRFYDLLRYLEKQGFTSKQKVVGRRESRWRLTKEGEEKFKVLSEEPKNKINLRPIKPKGKPVEDHLKIIVFDIPEKKRSYRAWIRQTLENYNYHLLQKSVWIGKAKLPEEFIQKLKEYNFLDCVHIFSVADQGTIR